MAHGPLILGHGVVIYFIITQRRQNSKNLPLSEKSCRPPSYFVLTAIAIITHAKSYDLSAMSILSVVRYSLLLNQLRAFN